MGKVRNTKGVVFTKRAKRVFNSQVKYNISGVNANPPSRDLRHKVTNSREKTRKFALFCLVLLGFVKRKHYTIVLQILPSLQVSLSSDSQPPNWEMQRIFFFHHFQQHICRHYLQRDPCNHKVSVSVHTDKIILLVSF